MAQYPLAMRHRSPPPRQTGRADFPHPAFLKPLSPRHAQGVEFLLGHGPSSHLGQEVESRTGACPSGPPHVSWEHRSGRGPSLHGHYPASTLLLPPPIPGQAERRYSFPSPVDPTSRSFHPDGPPRFLGRSLDARRPLPPRGVRPLPVLVAWRPMSGFTSSGGLATPRLRVSRGRTGFAYATAGVVAFSGFDGRVTPDAAESATW